MPEGLIRSRGAKDMRAGESGYFPVTALRVAVDRTGWIDPLAERIEQCSFDAPVLSFECVGGGFRIGFVGVRSYRWETGPRPDSGAGGLDWLPVVEFVWPDRSETLGLNSLARTLS
jgi:hypothetical protein